MVDQYGRPMKKDEIRRMQWESIRTQTFRLPNGVILHARSEIEAGAYENNGAVIVDTIYKDDE